MKELIERMDKTIAVFQNELGVIRAGRANPSMLDKISVDYYGTMTPVAQVGTVSVPEPRTILIQPWDASILSAVEKAISQSELGINPNNDGKVIRLNFPPLTEERRKELVKVAHKKAEEAKVAIRAIRRDEVERAKAQKKDGEITEDDLKDIENEIQKDTDAKIKEIDNLLEKKEKEIIEV